MHSLDAANCYRQSSMLCVLVTPVSTAKMIETHVSRFRNRVVVGSKEPCIRWGCSAQGIILQIQWINLCSGSDVLLSLLWQLVKMWIRIDSYATVNVNAELFQVMKLENVRGVSGLFVFTVER